LQASEAEVTKLKADLQQQKTDLEAAAAAKLEEAEATFTKQLAEMQTLLSDYQTQVRTTVLSLSNAILLWYIYVTMCGEDLRQEFLAQHNISDVAPV
jgi:malate synthase